jgi:hypothetical protein
MNPNSHHPALDVQTRVDPGWTAAALFLDAFARRDFGAVSSCLDPDVCFRALVPPGPFTTVGAAATAGHLERWFGGDDTFEVVDASIGQLGKRIYLRWRVRMHSASNPNAARVVEQHAFATATEHIQSLDLLCSGFQTEDTPRRTTALDSCDPAADTTDRKAAKS